MKRLFVLAMMLVVLIVMVSSVSAHSIASPILVGHGSASGAGQVMLHSYFYPDDPTDERPPCYPRCHML